jgi:aryl-alcohol dehydrogenase-like predicted oxidoreductase
VRRQTLGSHGPKFSVIGFGAWEAGGDVWGPNESDQRVIDAVQAGLDAGISWIDTAEVYGDGSSERLVGRAIEGRRDEVLIATKVAPRPDGTGFRPDQVRNACRQSLDRLGISHIDLYQLHWTDDGVPVEDTWSAMAELVDEGLVRHIGVSNFDRPLIERCEVIRRVNSIQPHFSMLHLENRDLIRWCGERGIGVVCYGPLAFGLLTGTITSETEFDPSDWRSGKQWTGGYYRALFAPGKMERSLAVVEGVRPIAARLGISVGQLALAWTFHQPGVTAAIAGSRNPDHVRENAAAGDVDLDAETLKELEDLLRLGPDFG